MYIPNINQGQRFTPLMRTSLLLSASVVTAKYCNDHLGVFGWLLLTGIALILAYASRKNLYSHCIALYICIFCIGGTLTAHKIDENHAPCRYVAKTELSLLDRARLNITDKRQSIEKQIQHLCITDQDLAVVSAMVLGDKSALSQETKESYSRSGASHILAVSGLHIGIIFQLFIILLGGKRHRKINIGLSTTAVWMYVVFIGMPASAVRSAVMISCYGFVEISYRRGSPINTLAFAYVLMLLINPLSLFDISFQMSFLAVFSILLVFPPLYKVYVPAHRISRWVWGLLCVSLAAQLGTIPLIAYYFGRISCYSLLTSLIAIPAATAILYLCAMMLVISLIATLPILHTFALPILQITAKVLVSITQAANTAFELTARMPGASIENIHISLPQLLLIYLILVLGYLLYRRTHKMWHTLQLLDKVINRNKNGEKPGRLLAEKQTL